MGDVIYNGKTDSKLQVTLDPGAYMPVRAHATDAGLDLKAMSLSRVPANSFAMINTGVHVAIPDGCVGLLLSKSGLMARGLTCRGVIDSGYRGPIQAIVFNHTDTDYWFDAGDKVTQLVIEPCLLMAPELVKELGDTPRGAGGIGSTGKR